MRTVFQWADDRWSHHIEHDAVEPCSIIMRSIEGAPVEFWPPSPVIQELQFQIEPDGTPAAMGVGMSGGSHWSFSCRGCSELNRPDVRWLLFDVACRTHTEFERIGSCYRICPEVTSNDHETGLLFRSMSGNWRIQASAEYVCVANQTLRMDIFGRGELMLPRTIQWFYVIEPQIAY